jgi:hypothetical protein
MDRLPRFSLHSRVCTFTGTVQGLIAAGFIYRVSNVDSRDPAASAPVEPRRVKFSRLRGLAIWDCHTVACGWGLRDRLFLINQACHRSIPALLEETRSATTAQNLASSRSSVLGDR